MVKNVSVRLLFFVSLSVFIATGCKFEGGVFDPNGVLLDDYLKSKVLSNPLGVSDNSTLLTLVVQLINEDDKVVSGTVPDPVVSGAPTLVGSCTASDSSGKSSCSFISPAAGTFNVSFTLQGHTFTVPITFSATSTMNTIGLASGADHKMTHPFTAPYVSGEWRASGSIGSQTSQSVLTNGGWKAYIDVQPSIVSQ